MRFAFLSSTPIALLMFAVIPALAEEIAECPHPLFECVGPGPGEGGTPPGNPPDPIFKPVAPVLDTYVDFNRSFGVIQNGKLSVTKGAPDIGSDLADYLSRNRSSIDPNSVYLLSPNSVLELAPGVDGVIIGGGALTQ